MLARPRNPDSPGAIRNRRYRERQRAGCNVRLVEISDEAIDALVRLGFLTSWGADDPAQVAEAMAAYLETALARDVLEHAEPCDASRHSPEISARIDTVREVFSAPARRETGQPDQPRRRREN